MLYVRFSPISPDQWEVFTPVKSTVPIAKVTLYDDGQCSAAITAGHAISTEERSSISVFLEEQEARVQA